MHGTTTADNTMIEMNGAATGLLVTEGHRDEIELRRCHKEQIWDPSAPGPLPIAPTRADPDPRARRLRRHVLRALDEDAVRRGVRRLKALGVRSIAVMYLFSFVNPAHERRTRDRPRGVSRRRAHLALARGDARGPEFERVSTTLVNAYVAPDRELRGSARGEAAPAGYGGPLLIMQSTGGVMPPDYVARRAVSLLASGPTGGVMGATVAADQAGIDQFVAVDMGGTSFDLCLVRDGQPEIKTDWNWRYRYYIGLPMVDVQSVGAGGGSIARAPGRAARRPGIRRVRFRARSATEGAAPRRPSPTPTRCSATCRPASRAGACTSTSKRPRAIRTDVAEPLGMDVVEAAGASSAS